MIIKMMILYNIDNLYIKHLADSLKILIHNYLNKLMTINSIKHLYYFNLKTCRILDKYYKKLE
jgi:hypothetical protein